MYARRSIAFSTQLLSIDTVQEKQSKGRWMLVLSINTTVRT